MPKRTKQPVAVSPIVRQIVDRCHVGETNLTVIRFVISRLREKHKTYKRMSRKDRRDLLRQIIQVHTENRQLYHKVMTGRF